MDVYGKENILSTPDRTETSMPSSASNKPAPMRPLTAAYQAARSDHQVHVSHKIHSDFLKCNLNSLSPQSDQHQFSPNTL